MTALGVRITCPRMRGRFTPNWRNGSRSLNFRSAGASGKDPSAGLNVSSVCRTGLSPRARRFTYLEVLLLGHPEVYMTNSAFAN